MNFVDCFLQNNSSIEKIQTAGAGISTEEDMDINEAVGSNEIVYCICQNVAYGSMVACDNIEVYLIPNKEV